VGPAAYGGQSVVEKALSRKKGSLAGFILKEPCRIKKLKEKNENITR
jgi:hypothetical protein